MEWTTIGDRGRLFEGARWLPDPGVFQWVDIFDAAVLRWDPQVPDTVERRDLDLEFVSVALPIDADLQLVASRNSVGVYDWSSDSFRVLDTIEVDGDIRFNDGGISPTGQVFVGTMSMAQRPDAAHLYRVDETGLTPVIGGVGISNGLAWFDDTTALYVDSFSGEVSALTFRDGIPVDRTPVAVFERPEEPDGLVIGPSGEALVAIWRGARVAQLDPATGSTLGEFAVPANFPTSVAVGAGLMLVTTADHVEDDVDPGPLGGHVLCRPYEPPPQQVVR